MKQFQINKTDIFISYIEEYNLVKIRLESDLRITTSFNIKEKDFINLLIATEVVEIQNGIILWDEYIEDDGETTRFNQHPISLKDYVSNYISSPDILDVLNLILWGVNAFLTNKTI
jgi:hypothetical protein